MAFTKVTKDMNIIAALPDKPNDTGEHPLSADGLKAKFDEAGLALKEYLNNTLIAELEGAGAAGKLGIEAIEGLAATTVQAALEALYQAISDVTVGALPDGSVTTAKLGSLAVTADKLADDAVTAAKIKNGEVGANELASSAVETGKIKSQAVTTSKLKDGAVTNVKMASGSVGTDQLKSDLVVPVANGGTGATSADGAISQLGAQKAIQSSNFSLAGGSSWSARSGGGFTQTVTVSGITENSAFVAAPSDETSWKRAQDANLFPPTSGTNSLTFTCDTKPTDPISVTVYYW